MTSPYRGPLIRTDFADVLATVRRGSAAGIGDDVRHADAPHGEAAAPDLVAHASFDFLQALDTVSEQLSTQARAAAGGPAGHYAQEDVEATAGEAPPVRPLPGDEQAQEVRPVPAEAAADPSAGACDPASLAAELGLRAGLQPVELRRIRRAFALANHPDRLDPSRREAASRRMTLANALIDEALRLARP